MQSPLKLYNSLTRKEEEFKPINPPHVSLYTCGTTVYNTAHIGNVKTYISEDILRRVLQFNGYDVKHVQNVTDVGHLVSDADEGEDKLEKGARESGEDIWALARRLEDLFYTTLDKVNVLRPTIVQRATDPVAIQKQIEMIQKIIDNGYGYVADSAVYFDVSKLPEYNPFSNQSLEDKINGAREDVISDSQKKHPADFALWVFRKGIHEHHIMHWDSPWGDGFPGWHIECSAISIGNLGESIDIHAGGVDHLGTHHPNEIAQNFAYTGHEVVHLWFHSEFILVDAAKMSKSKKNFYILEDLIERGFDPLAYRYFVLGTQYRKPMNFTWQALESAQTSLQRLRKSAPSISEHTFDDDERAQIKSNPYFQKFHEAVNDDLNTPKALAVVWELLEDSSSDSRTKALLLSEFDEVLGLNIYSAGEANDATPSEIPFEDLPEDIQQKISLRETYRADKKFAEADTLRKEIESAGYSIRDRSEGMSITPSSL